MQEVQFYERAQAQTHSMIRNLPEEMVVDRCIFLGPSIWRRSPTGTKTL
jgi:hypothetical protein